jgi:hypothetical protein
MAIKERRIRCAACGERDTVLRGERGPVTAYCDLCRAEHQREQARQRMAAMRARRRLARGAASPSGELEPG